MDINKLVLLVAWIADAIRPPETVVRTQKPRASIIGVPVP